MRIKRLHIGKLNWKIIILAGLSLVIYLITSHGYVNFNQPTVFDDEFGYWLGSAYLMGDDWSEVARYTSYYSYGYGFLVGAPLRMFVSQLFIYSAAIRINALLLVGSFLIACYMSNKVVPQIKAWLRYLLCFVLCIYPSYIVFSHMTWAECLLVFLFWVYVWLSYRTMMKPTYMNHAAIGLLTIVVYAVHQRTLAVTISAVIIMFALYTIERDKRLYLVVFYLAFTAAMLGHCYIKADLLRRYYGVDPGSSRSVYMLLAAGAVYIGVLFLPSRLLRKLFPVALAVGCIALFWLGKRYLYPSTGVPYSHVTNNNLAGQTGKIKYILTTQGAWTMLFSVTSKAFYLLMSTSLMIYWGLERCLRGVFRILVGIYKDIRGKAKITIDHRQLWYSWLLLIFIGSFAIMAIFMVIFTRVDCLMYGRYVEHILGIYVMIGVGNMLDDRKWWIKLIVLGAAGLIFGYIAAELVVQSGISAYSPYHVVYMDYWFQKYTDQYEAIRTFARDGLIISAVVIGILKVAAKGRINDLKVIVLTCALTTAFVYSAYKVIDYNIMRFQNTRNRNYRPIVWEIEKYDGDHSNRIYYCRNTEVLIWSQLFQFLLGHETLHLTNTDDIDPDEEAFYIMGITQTGLEDFNDKYYPIMTTEKYVLCTSRGTELEASIRAKKGE